MIRIRATGADGVMRCANCTKALTEETSEIDHYIPWEISHYSGPSKRPGASATPLSCHELKSGQQAGR